MDLGKERKRKKRLLRFSIKSRTPHSCVCIATCGSASIKGLRTCVRVYMQSCVDILYIPPISSSVIGRLPLIPHPSLVVPFRVAAWFISLSARCAARSPSLSLALFHYVMHFLYISFSRCTCSCTRRWGQSHHHGRRRHRRLRHPKNLDCWCWWVDENWECVC